jgi:hypothetical protein
MISAINHSCLHFIRETHRTISNVWRAVCDFFSSLCLKIERKLQSCMNWIWVQIDSSLDLIGLGNPDTPQKRIVYFQKAIQDCRKILELKAPNEGPNVALATFNEGWEDLTGMTQVAFIIVKSYIVSDHPISSDLFSKTEWVDGREIIPPIMQGDHVIYAGGPVRQLQTIDYSTELNKIQKIFNSDALSSQEREIIIQLTDPDISHMHLSQEAMRMVKKIAAISSKLSQGETTFLEAIQKVHGYEFPPPN